MPETPTLSWITTLAHATAATIVSDSSANVIPLHMAIERVRDQARHMRARGGPQWGRFFLIGNGGSLAIASHMATDFCLAKWPSLALSDVVALSSHTNDYGPQFNFSHQLELIGMRRPDTLIALSCSGQSMNILDACAFATAQACDVITFSGFEPDNPLRRHGALNFYVPARNYGHVQLAHASLLHAAVDIEMGWGGHE